MEAAGKQSDGDKLTPYEQAQRYVGGLSYSQYPRWIVTCNFKSFKVYDMEQPQAEPMEILLENLERESTTCLSSLWMTIQRRCAAKEISIKAGELIGKLYNELYQQYHNPDTPKHSIR